MRQSIVRTIAACVAVGAASPALAQPAPIPIPGAGDWLISDNLPGVPQKVCTARINGAQADTMMMLNDDDRLLLVAGHPEWRKVGAEPDATLSIDGEPPERIEANALANLVLTLVRTDAMLERLKRAKTLDWTLSTGRFHAEVSGLGVAYEAIKACKTGRGGSAPARS